MFIQYLICKHPSKRFIKRRGILIQKKPKKKENPNNKTPKKNKKKEATEGEEVEVTEETEVEEEEEIEEAEVEEVIDHIPLHLINIRKKEKVMPMRKA